MAKKSKAERELDKKQKRRIDELAEVNEWSQKLYGPVPPKKPAEFKFNREDVNSFEYPVAIGNTVLEKKSDGYCVHVIIDQKAPDSRDKIRIYSSGSNLLNAECFPELKRELLKLPSGYYHGELLGKNPDGRRNFMALDEFVAIDKRAKLKIEKLTPALIEQYPLRLDIFDVLRVEKKPMLAVPFSERRVLLEERVGSGKNVSLIPEWNVNSKEDLQKLFLKAIGNGYEGLIAKDPASLYIPDSRNSDWIKIKEFTTLDLAILGLYETPESKATGKPFSAALIGTYNNETEKFETLGKVKVGAIEDQRQIMEKLPQIIPTGADYHKVIEATNNITFNPAMQKIKRKIPDYVVQYDMSRDIVIGEFKILNVMYAQNWLSCGLLYNNKEAHSLRLADFKQLRTDKTRLQDVNTTRQVHDFYTG